jgi:23S rRNA (guanosine2251-2'-O)-methyltransferase
MRHRGHLPAQAADATTTTSRRRDSAPGVLCGLNAVREALRAGARRIERIWLAEHKAGRRIADLMALAAAAGTAIEIKPAARLTEVAGTPSHQGIVAFLAVAPLMSLEELIVRVMAQTRTPTVVVLDHIKDPRNLGAIVRSAAAFGIGGVILPHRRSVGHTATVAKAASGGLEYVAMAGVTNVSQSLERLKEHGFWVIGADEDGEIPCDAFAFPSRAALVLGEEGMGLSPLVKRRCDLMVRIPVEGPLRSLNVAVAAAVLFYEVSRQRRPSMPTASTHPGKA